VHVACRGFAVKHTDITVNERHTKKYRQAQFMRALLLGYTIVSSARIAGISERTAFYWLKDPEFQAERKRLAAALSEVEWEEFKKLSIESVQKSYYDRYPRERN